MGHRQRMQTCIKNSVCVTQYGFRPQRSTSHALYVIRRIQDYTEVKDTPIEFSPFGLGESF